jgi:hypothetical protein
MTVFTPMDWLTYFVGLGLAVAKVGDSYDNPSESYALDVAATHETQPGIEVGMHVRVSHVEGQTGDRGGPRSQDTQHRFYTYDVAATAHFVAGRVVFAPWLGWHLASGSRRTLYGAYDPDPTPPPVTEDAGPLLGLSLGGMISFDILRMRGNALAVYAEAQVVAPIEKTGTDEWALTAGVAVRF